MRNFRQHWRFVNLSLLSRSMERDKWAHNHWFLIGQTQNIGMSLAEDNTSNQNSKPFTPLFLTLSTSTIITIRQNLHLVISTLGALLTSRPTILSRFEQNCIFASSIYIFEFDYVRTWFVSMFHLFAISSSQCTPTGSAERSTDPFLVAWAAHNLLTALPFCFCLNRHYIFAISLFIFLSFNMPEHISFLWFICYFSIPVRYKRLSRVIYPHNFNCSASTQSSYCITCLATSHLVAVWADNCLSASSCFSYAHNFLV